IDGAGSFHVFGTAAVNVNAGANYAITGPTQITAGTLAFNASPLIPLLSLQGGALAGTGLVTVTGTGSWTGGTMTGGGTTAIAPGATLAMSGTLEMANRTLNNDGTMNWTGGTLDPNGSNTLNNRGTWTLQNNPALIHNIGGFGSLTIDNSGTIQQTSGTGVTTLGAAGSADVSLINTGLVDVQTGELRLASATPSSSTGEYRVASGAVLGFASGTHDFNGGALIDGAGSFHVFGTAAVNVNSGANYAITGPTQITAGTLAFNASPLVPLLDL